MLQPDLKTLLDLVVDQVLQAGRLLSAEWGRVQGPRGHGDKAPVDVEIEQQLRGALLHLLPCDFWGEETGHVLTGNSWCWVIDPNDGTSDFLKGRKGSAVSVGLLRDAQPVLGVVHAPVTPDRGADCIAWAEGLPHLLRNGQPVVNDLRQQRLGDRAMVMVSAAAETKPQVNAELCAPAQFRAMPSIAYRLARVAAGDAVCAVSLYPVSAHDVVAGHALLLASGGVLLDQDGQPIHYRTASEMAVVSSRCFGGAPQACQDLLRRDWERVLR
ncbi:inositol monophosphatase family protein [Pseudomonas sp. JG-B]|uniref:inositol monophosphatase family protein n=1 Tax=Pseudomonas sp. JG-B TaxID=2603214 RepID=UPI00129D49F5|nr:inositol monophosphatase family protein [Pseudomonas sp. JG-B]MRK21895.1 inositol monophosphatase [Pseudomonas sp. JG-B]